MSRRRLVLAAAIAPLIDNGNVVPVAIHVDSPMAATDHVQRMALFTELNPLPEVAVFHLGPRSGVAQVATRMRLATSQTLTTLALMKGGSLRQQQVDVIVTLAECIESRHGHACAAQGPGLGPHRRAHRSPRHGAAPDGDRLSRRWRRAGAGAQSGAACRMPLRRRRARSPSAGRATRASATAKARGSSRHEACAGRRAAGGGPGCPGAVATTAALGLCRHEPGHAGAAARRQPEPGLAVGGRWRTPLQRRLPALPHGAKPARCGSPLPGFRPGAGQAGDAGRPHQPVPRAPPAGRAAGAGSRNATPLATRSTAWNGRAWAVCNAACETAWSACAPSLYPQPATTPRHWNSC